MIGTDYFGEGDQSSFKSLSAKIKKVDCSTLFSCQYSSVGLADPFQSWVGPFPAADFAAIPAIDNDDVRGKIIIALEQ